MIRNRHVGVPLDIVDLRVLGHQVIHDLEDEVLDLRVCKVKHQLSTSTACHYFTLRSLEHPVRMLFIQFAGGVGHLRLNPYSETYAMLMGLLDKPSYAVRQLVSVHLPVTQSAVVGQTWILHSEPAVIHHEEFSSH